MALKEMTSFQNKGHLLPSETNLSWAYSYLLPKKTIEVYSLFSMRYLKLPHLLWKRRGLLAVILGQIFKELLGMYTVLSIRRWMSRDKARGWLESWCDVEICLVEKLGKNFRVSIGGQVQSFMEWWVKQQSYPQPACSTAYMCMYTAVYGCCEKHSPLCQIIGRIQSRCHQAFWERGKEKGHKGGKNKTEQ